MGKCCFVVPLYSKPRRLVGCTILASSRDSKTMHSCYIPLEYFLPLKKPVECQSILEFFCNCINVGNNKHKVKQSQFT